MLPRQARKIATTARCVTARWPAPARERRDTAVSPLNLPLAQAILYRTPYLRDEPHPARSGLPVPHSPGSGQSHGDDRSVQLAPPRRSPRNPEAVIRDPPRCPLHGWPALSGVRLWPPSTGLPRRAESL